MGKLINREKREKAKKQRAVRKHRILEEARSTFARMPYIEVTLATIGQQAGVDRGVASMYFHTREELFLLLLKNELVEWYLFLEEQFGVGEGTLGASEIARMLAGSLTDRPILTRFLSVTPAVLEQNIEAMEVYRFQRWRRDRMAEVGGLMERSTSCLGAGEGFRLLNLVHLLATGFEPAANPRGSAAFDRGDPDFAGFWIDLQEELERIIVVLLSTGD
jgi:AcrR family transcriptional regulator